MRLLLLLLYTAGKDAVSSCGCRWCCRLGMFSYQHLITHFAVRIYTLLQK